MSAPIMGPRRYREVLAAAGLQPSDIHERDPHKCSAMWAALWRALEYACDEHFVVDLYRSMKGGER